MHTDNQNYFLDSKLKPYEACDKHMQRDHLQWSTETNSIKVIAPTYIKDNECSRSVCFDTDPPQGDGSGVFMKESIMKVLFPWQKTNKRKAMGLSQLQPIYSF